MAKGHRRQSLLSKISRIAISVLPLAGEKIQNVPIIWPPLGSIETYAAGMATVIIGAFGALPTLFKTKGAAKAGAGIGLAVALISLTFYGNYLLTYVKGVETPNSGTQYRTIGGQRTEEALQKLPKESDQGILEIAGLTDGDIERMWTPSSVRDARLQLFISYVIGLASINFALGSFARASASAPNPK